MAAEEKLFIKENTLELLAKVSYKLFSTTNVLFCWYWHKIILFK